MEKEDFFRVYKQVKNNKFKNLENLDFKLLHRINTMLLYEIEITSSLNTRENIHR